MQQIIHTVLLCLIQLFFRLLSIHIQRRCGGQGTDVSSDKAHNSYCPFPYLHLTREDTILWYSSDPLALGGHLAQILKATWLEA